LRSLSRAQAEVDPPAEDHGGDAMAAENLCIENHIRGALRTYGLLIGAAGRARYRARVHELLEHCDPIFAATIEVMLDVRRAIFAGYERLH
jgi:hypothetical protein